MKRSSSDARSIIPGHPPLSRRRNASAPFRTARLSINNESEYLCDRTVEFKDSGAIRNIIGVEFSEKCIYFEKLFKYNPGHRGTIMLPEFLHCIFDEVVEYLRHGTVSLKEETVCNLFIAADFLLLFDLKEKCAKFLSQLADDATYAIRLWLSARNLNWPEVGEMAYEKLLLHFENVWTSGDFLDLSFTDLHQLLLDDGLNCESELTIFDAVRRWVGHQPITRLSKASELFICCRLGLLSEQEMTTLRESEVIRKFSGLQRIVDSWPNCLFQNDLLDSRTVPRLITPRQPHHAVLVFGGWCDGQGPKAAAQAYDPNADTWTLWPPPGDPQADNSHHLGEIPKRVYAGCVAVEHRVYLIGGFDGNSALKSTLQYDFESDSGWMEISCMYEKRYYVSVAYADGFIYACGGHNGDAQGRLNSAERFDIRNNLWQPIASMNKVRSDASAAELHGKIYVCGGFEGARYHDSGEYYDSSTNEWTQIAPMCTPRGGISLVRHGNYIYAIGGNDGSARVNTIERYEPLAGKWEVVGNMVKRKSNLSSTVVNDDIFIIGGWSDEPNTGILDTVERFNVQSRTCVVVSALRFAASATCSCTLSGRKVLKRYIRRSVRPIGAGRLSITDQVEEAEDATSGGHPQQHLRPTTPTNNITGNSSA